MLGATLSLLHAGEEPGRTRILWVTVVAMLVVAGFLWLRYGWKGLRIETEQLPEDVCYDVVDPAADTAPGAAAPPPKVDDAAALKAELDRLRGAAAAPTMSSGRPPPGLPPPPLTVLPDATAPAAQPSAAVQSSMTFATGAQPTGHGSMTAQALDDAAQAAAASAAAGGGFALPADLPGAYAPLAPAYQDQLKRQAREVRRFWEVACDTAVGDTHWLPKFWAQVHGLDTQEGLNSTLATLLQGHGYQGLHSTTLPAASLTADLASLAMRGLLPAPCAAAPLTPLQPVDESRFRTTLPIGLRRAALEIYDDLLGQGANTVREWLQCNHPDSRSDHRWTDLWTSAVTVDWELAQAKTDAEKVAALQSSDALELHLRRLSSFAYEKRTRDVRGAQRILAQRAPGSQGDLGPKWLIDEATAFTKVEFQRDSYVRGRGRGGSWGGGSSSGGGRGDGGGGGGAAAASGSPFAAGDASAPDGAGGGGGRSRGGRGGGGRGGGGRRGRGSS